MENNEILDSDLSGTQVVRRRKLLPWWMKIFIWMFLIFGVFAPLGIIFGVFGGNFEISLFGLKTMEPFSLIGITLICIYIFKGITAYGLWTEKDWAINIGQIDAIMGIFICLFLMIVAPIVSDGKNFIWQFRFELVLLIPYLIKLRNIKPDWEKAKKIIS